MIEVNGIPVIGWSLRDYTAVLVRCEFLFLVLGCFECVIEDYDADQDQDGSDDSGYPPGFAFDSRNSWRIFLIFVAQ